MGIIETDKQIRDLIIAGVEEELQAGFNKAAKGMKPGIRTLITNAIHGTLTYKSLIGGQLRAEFGLTGATAKLAAIINQWASNVVVTARRVSLRQRSAQGVISIRAIQTDWQDVLSLSDAKQLIESGERLDWLEWLLLRGDEIIIRDYHIQKVPGRRGRGGPYIMEPGGQWRVPSQHAGTSSRNFITKAIDGIEKELQKVVIDNLKRSF